MIGETKQTWIGVDLDGVLSRHYWPDDGPYDDLRIGEPIPVMVERVKAWRAQGWEVRIFTARINWPSDHHEAIRDAIKSWSREVFGCVLPMTASKDPEMLALYDDRAVHIVRDAGVPCCAHAERSLR